MYVHFTNTHCKRNDTTAVKQNKKKLYGKVDTSIDSFSALGCGFFSFAFFAVFTVPQWQRQSSLFNRTNIRQLNSSDLLMYIHQYLATYKLLWSVEYEKRAKHTRNLFDCNAGCNQLTYKYVFNASTGSTNQKYAPYFICIHKTYIHKRTKSQLQQQSADRRK